VSTRNPAVQPSAAGFASVPLQVGGRGTSKKGQDRIGVKQLGSRKRTISSIDAKNRFGQHLAAAQRAPVTVTKNGRPAAVVMSVEDYERMRGLPGSVFSRR
jgi:prevent-host-death family protein